ncbi:hypothetical protein M422DRAFT_275804 [Sphaerobolus stellatus SS14]|uniref:Uncharacterized protein n=1 Tax=Sphaerobolus stellatus (strain SS14) TaxID=990650 RepID=A0A0C9UDQ5_SPHS4|nr:hypothetical protein M422DRAFT_275804 [Sphaerobolus stellatus SS14]
MSYCQLITDEQLALFLEAAKLLMIPMNEVPPAIVEAVPAPSVSQNETILTMHQALIAETIKRNTKMRRTAYLDVKRKVEEAEVKRMAEEAVAKKAAEEENASRMDANSEGEDEVNKDEMPKLKLKKKTKSHLIVDSESEEETKEVKAKRRKAKGKEKAIDTEYKRNTVPVDYAGCPGVPVRKICEGCKVLANAWYQRP